MKEAMTVNSPACKREKSEFVEPGRNGSDSLTLTDPEVLDCSICNRFLTIPVYQCENGHVTCSFCCTKVMKECPFCCSPLALLKQSN